MTRFLTPQQVLFIHARLIAETGGEHGVRSVELLESAVARPKATFDGNALYETLFLKAAALMESLIQNHPFVDGNKRTAITSAALFLQMNGRFLQTTQDELVNFTMGVTRERPSLSAIAVWFEENCVAADD